MEIVLADNLGFCMGVKRAVDMAYRALDKAEGAPVVTLGPLIHNTQEIERLRNDGVGMAEVDALTCCELIGVIAQTTISPQKYQAIIDVLKTKAKEVKVCETICDATTENQGAIRELSAEVDLLYVIGGRHSANSNKLVETA